MTIRRSLAVAVVALAAVSAAASPAKRPKEYAMHAHRPEYPAEARRLGLEGAGVYALHIRADGTVESVAVTKSSGHAILDRAAVAAFMKWRFHPTGKTRVVPTPMSFTMSGYRKP